MKNWLKDFFYLLDRKVRLHIAFLIFLFVISSFLDMFGIGMVSIFVSTILGNSHADHFGVLKFINHFSSAGWTQQKLVMVSSIVILSAFFMKTIFGCWVSRRAAIFSFRQADAIRYKFMCSYKCIRYILLLSKNTSELINLLSGQITQYTLNTLLAALNLVATIFTTVFIMGLLLIASPFTTLSLLVVLGFFCWVYLSFLKDKLAYYSKEQLRENTKLNKGIQQFFRGFKEIRVLQKEDFFVDRVRESSGKLASVQGDFYSLQPMPRYIMELIMVSFIVMVSLVMLFVYGQQESALPLLSMFVVAGVRLMPVMTQFLSFFTQIKYSAASLAAISKECRDIEDLDSVASLGKINQDFSFRHLKLSNVGYCYPGSFQQSLSTINMEIRFGESVGVMGTTGAGKTTLINLLIGLLEPTQGIVEINEKNIKTVQSSWLSKVAYIPQDAFLLDDTLRNNILFGEVGEDNHRMREAIELARLKTVVEHLSEGLDTQIGENGVKLSGGQKQRVALARAFYHQRDVIVMDEATSALDNETEREVIESIKSLHGIKTLIIIAHRLSTIEHCDTVYKLTNGKIVSSGDFESVVS